MGIEQRSRGWSRWWPDRGRRAARRRAAHEFYCQLVNRARQPAFYRELGVPDTPEGRFEMIALHVAMMIRRLRAEGDEGRALSQALFDLMFADMDAGLRELGVGDLSVGKYVKRLARNFHARLVALDTALDGDQPDLLRRMLETNAYHGGPAPAAAQLAALVAYVGALDGLLAAHPSADLSSRRLSIPDVEDLLPTLPN